jgi:TolA-binding protein
MYVLRKRYRLFAALALLALSATHLRADALEDAFQAAATHYDQQRFPDAIEGYRKLLASAPAKHPRVADARFFMAEALLQERQDDEAAKEFALLLDQHPQSLYSKEATFRIAEVAYRRGDYAAALPKLKAFVAANGAHALCAYALPYLGDCQLELGDLDAAERTYQSAIKQFAQGPRAKEWPLAGECRLGLGRIAEQQGNMIEAQRFYTFVAQERGSTAAAEAQLQLGRLLYQQRDYAAAARHLSTLAQSETPHDQRASARYWFGLTLVAQDHAADAQALWQQAIEEEPQHPFAPACALAVAQSLAATDTNKAASWCARIVRDWPTSPDADDAAALAIELLLAQRKQDEVAAAAAAFASKYPRSPLLLSVRETQARALLEQAHCDQAIALLEPLLKTPAGQRAQLCYLLALAHLGAKQFEPALAALAKIDLEAASDELRGAVLAARGSALVSLKRGAEAVAPLQQYLRDYADGGDAASCRARLCVAYMQAGKIKEARTAWRDFAAKHATDRALLPMALYLADEATAAGQQATAQEWLEFVAAPEHPASMREQALQRLAVLARKEKSPEAKRAGSLLKSQPKDDVAANVELAQAERMAAEEQADAALAAYLQWLKDYPTAAKRPVALLSAARLHRGLAQNHEALDLLKQLQEQHPQFAELDAALFETASALSDLDRRDEAAQQLESLLDRFPQSATWEQATYRLAEERFRQQRDADANQLLVKLAEQGKDADLVCRAFLLQGRAAATAQRWNDVAAPLEQLLIRFPQSEHRPIAKYWIAESYYRRGEWKQAGEKFAELGTEVGERQDAWVPMVALREAQVLAHQQQWQAAYDAAAAIEKQHPNFRQQYEVDYLLGRCLGALAKFDEARAAYQRVVQSPVGGRTQTAAMAQWMIGEAYFQQERYDDAIAAYTRVEKLFAFERWQAAALLQAGKCRETQGRYADAIALYAQLLKQHSETTVAQEASQRLRVAEQRAASAKTKVE